MKPMFKWIGGKGKLLPFILPLIPEHKIYVEVFGGSGAVLFGKKPSSVEVINDINSDIVNVYRVARDADKLRQLAEVMELMPFSKEEWRRNQQKSAGIMCSDGDVGHAAAWLHVLYNSFGAKVGGSWGHAVTSSAHGMSSRVSAYLSMVKRLPDVHARLRTVQVDNDDFRLIVNRYDTPDTLFYFDPPYVTDTRTTKIYRNELRQRDHLDLMNLCLGLKGKAIYSGYKHHTMRVLEVNGWNRIDIPVKSTVGWSQKTKDTYVERTESLWFNFPPAVEASSCETNPDLLEDHTQPSE